MKLSPDEMDRKRRQHLKCEPRTPSIPSRSPSRSQSPYPHRHRSCSPRRSGGSPRGRQTFASGHSKRGMRSRSANGRRRSWSRECRDRRSSHSPRSPANAGRRKADDGEDVPRPCRVLGVFGLNYHTTKRDLEREFARFGRLDRVDLVGDPFGRSRGFGFVSYERQGDADKAREVMADTVLDGKRIRVDYSISRGPHQRTPGMYLGNNSGIQREYYANSNTRGCRSSAGDDRFKRRSDPDWRGAGYRCPSPSPDARRSSDYRRRPRSRSFTPPAARYRNHRGRESPCYTFGR